jgi:type I restriction enzyme M protein
MLDTKTKKNIDDCRDVLVGKVPDPKSQIEQITLALIYKFMDDMDKEAVEKFKGKAKFFTGEYAKYGWRKLFDPSLSGQDMLSLYSEALEKLNTNPNIPELFRNIFKNAYLPYRDPSTLKLFLKHINEFEYSHSEKLGDAFEYLLSVMGSQGDAGQFRTPRHIIDFVTACINPQKNETVLDPACGTAGFLLSAYKHILNQNTEKRLGDKLKPDDRKKLATNFVGYDISPDMVRLSLANMYLHGFATPQIHEYDTLSSEDRWQETFDVILANPPFMTPKGGIRPHKKFGVQANKAEVLFTDYIAEHLNPNGRAGIVVPNGIVATSQTAYKQLRKMLVQDSLLAVISLPAGCFNPYSGVKTSILILDKKLAKKSQHILFLKIENDGFDLGAQRREIDKNDLPLALEILQKYKEVLVDEKNIDKIKDIVLNPKDSDDYRINNDKNNTTPKGSNNLKTFNARNIKSRRDSLATLVEKEIVLGNKDVVLSAERYFKKEVSLTEFDLVPLNEICKVINGKAYKQEELLEKGKYLVLRVGNFFTNKSWYYSDLELPEDKYCDKGDLLYAWSASFGPRIWEGEKVIYHYHIWKMIPDETRVLKKYLYLVLDKETERMKAENTNGSTMLHLTKEGIEQLEIPLPPLEIQQQIVAEIEGYQKIIDGAKQIVNNYKPTIKINPDWEMVELGEVCEINAKAIDPVKAFGNESFVYIDIEAVENGTGLISYNKEIIPKDAPSRARRVVKNGDVALSTVRPNLKAFGFIENAPKNCLASTGFAILSANEKIKEKFLFYSVYQDYLVEQMILKSDKGQYPSITASDVAELQIAIPSLEEQVEIVERIEEEQALVNGNKKLIALFEQKIKNKLNEVWGVKEKVGKI